MAKPANASATLKENWNFGVQVGLSFPLLGRHTRSAAPAPAPAPAPAAPPVVVNVDTATPPPAPPKPQDADGDGVPDSKDECKATPAGSLVDPAGCPVYRDSDADGVIDPRDRCPATPAGSTVDGSGCPMALDSDKDGVLDGMDTCPNTPTGDKVDAFGCSVKVDTDKDGVDDSRDKCPDTPIGTSVDANGCTVLFKPDTKKVTLRGVHFEAGKAVLTDSSLAVLDDVARQLIDNPDILIEVAGHTDNIGPIAKNMRLSQARADAVRNYLILKGVGAERLEAKGYGPTQPIASNKIRAGRIMNRRVELRRIN
jgi:OOP family OmpA-OmpF porin